MSKMIVGLVGEKGSGKETFGNFLSGIAKKTKVTRVRFSDILVETLRSWDLPLTRKNIQKMAVVMEDGFGKGTLTQAVKRRIAIINAEILILDGIRWLTDEKMLREIDNSLIVYITADLKLRFERIRRRTEKVGEGKSFRQFMKEEKAKNELFIGKIGKRADVKLENNGSLGEFKKKVEEFYGKFVVNQS